MRLIDADALVEKRWYADCRHGYVQVVGIGDIDDSPTVDPYKHGKWEFHGDDIVRCTACDMDYSLYRKILYPRNYCPNCGAKMDLK